MTEQTNAGDSAAMDFRDNPTVRLVGAKNFKRHNPRTDRFPVHGFHHIEFWCSDATMSAQRFVCGMGMQLVARSDLTTGNQTYASYVVKSGDLVVAFTAPFGMHLPRTSEATPHPGFDRAMAHQFVTEHGMAVRAVGLRVEDASVAFREAAAHGARPALEPTFLGDEETGQSCQIAEVEMYGDVVLRFVSGDFQGPFLPGYAAAPQPPSPRSFGLQRLDHVVGNVPELVPVLEYLMRATGFHEFAEFTTEDVGTVDSGLNSMVLANNAENVLLPVNEPTTGTKRKSQIQTYLEQNQGPGVQHLAFKTDDIFHTLTCMRAHGFAGGFEFMPRASDEYYAALPQARDPRMQKIGGALTDTQYAQCKELGILVDKDDQGVLLQIFTKPLGDRSTIFVEIIQRLCPREDELRAQGFEGAAAEVGGCGGFGKGNFSELFKSIEDYERTLDVAG